MALFIECVEYSAMEIYTETKRPTARVSHEILQ